MTRRISIPDGNRARYRDYVTFRLEWVSSIARAEADKVYERECGLSIRQLRVLRRVAEKPGCSVTEIVEDAMFERTLVSRLISQLVRVGFLVRRISSTDARQFHIDITAKGLAKADVADELGDRLNEDLLSCLDAEERAALDCCLQKLVRWHPATAKMTAPGRAASRPKNAASASATSAVARRERRTHTPTGENANA